MAIQSPHDYSRSEPTVAYQVAEEVAAYQASQNAIKLRAFGENPGATSGLTWAYYATRTIKRSPQGATSPYIQIGPGTVSLTANTTNFVEFDEGTHSVTTNTNGFTSGRLSLWEVVTNGDSIIGRVDRRSWLSSYGTATGEVGGGEETGTEEITLTFADAPAVKEYAVLVGDGTGPAIINGSMNAAAIQAALEGSDDLAGYTVEVTGSTTVSGTGDDGVDLYSGSFTIAITGPTSYPAFEVQNSEVQNWTVTSGDSDADYKPHTGATARALGQTESQIQTDLRALGGAFASVVVKGAISAPSAGDGYVVSGAGTSAVNGTYDPNGTSSGVPKFSKGSLDLRRQNVGINFWKIVTSDGATTYYEQTSDDTTPPASGWGVSEGANPAPTVAAESGAPGAGKYNIYFPYSAGNVAQIAPEGTGSSASTLAQGESASTEIVAS